MIENVREASFSIPVRQPKKLGGRAQRQMFSYTGSHPLIANGEKTASWIFRKSLNIWKFGFQAPPFVGVWRTPNHFVEICEEIASLLVTSLSPERLTKLRHYLLQSLGNRALIERGENACSKH